MRFVAPFCRTLVQPHFSTSLTRSLKRSVVVSNKNDLQKCCESRTMLVPEEQNNLSLQIVNFSINQDDSSFKVLLELFSLVINSKSSLTSSIGSVTTQNNV